LASAPVVAPEVFEGMNEVMRRIAATANVAVEKNECIEDVGVYVLSNKTGIYGAGTILYPGLLKQITEKLQSDLIIIPSSVHEVLLTRQMVDTDVEELKEMVELVNTTQVRPEERLSNHVYVYHRDTEQLEIAA
jgi:adenylate kinase